MDFLLGKFVLGVDRSILTDVPLLATSILNLCICKNTSFNSVKYVQVYICIRVVCSCFIIHLHIFEFPVNIKLYLKMLHVHMCFIW
jgi:hypothetical protein